MENFATLLETLANLKAQYDAVKGKRGQLNQRKLINLHSRLKNLKGRIDQYGCKDGGVLEIYFSVNGPNNLHYADMKIVLVGISEKSQEQWLPILQYRLQKDFGKGYKVNGISGYQWVKTGSVLPGS